MASPKSDSDLAALVELLRAKLDSLTATTVRRIIAEVDVYAEGALVEREDLVASCRSNTEFMIEQLTGPGRLDLSAPRHTGRRRAEQGVPLAAVLTGYRIGFDHIWHAILAEARAVGALTDATLLDIASTVWRMLGVYTTEMVTAYRDQQTEQVLRLDQERSALVEAVLGGRVADTGTVWEAADLLSLPYRGTFVVVAAESPSLGRMAMQGIDTRLAARGIGSAWRLHADFQVGVGSLRSAAGLDAVVEILESTATSRVGVSPVFTSLDGAARALHLARIALAGSAAGAATVTVFDEAPLPVLVVSSPTTSHRVVRTVLGPVLDLPDGERASLLETLVTYFDVRGSAVEAGRRLYLHPNTVRRRLHRIEHLTARSLDDPRASAELLVALSAYSRLPAAADD